MLRSGYQSLTQVVRSARIGLLCSATLLVCGVTAFTSGAASASPPAIRTSQSNHVPACVTPERLMRFLATRNHNLDPRFRSIATYYKKHGEALRVRWDYAFFQMAIETNFLTYRQGNGKWGDVNPRQNNFAGIGTTGGGVPGNSFKDVSTGVLAQLQHLVAYSGEHVANPVAQRTQLKQNDIIEGSRKIADRRPVTFQDLSGRWAVDRRYGRSIEYVAKRYRSKFCNGETDQVARSKAPPRDAERGARRVAAVKPAASPKATLIQTCKVRVAGDAGASTLLIRSVAGDTLNLTALDVRRGQEDWMEKNFIAAYAKGGRTIGTYPSRDKALKQAHALCNEATGAGQVATVQ